MIKPFFASRDITMSVLKTTETINDIFLSQQIFIKNFYNFEFTIKNEKKEIELFTKSKFLLQSDLKHTSTYNP